MKTIKEKKEKDQKYSKKLESILQNEVINKEIEDDFQCKNAIDIFRQLKKLHDNLEAERKEMTKPIDASKQVIMDKFSPTLNLIKATLGSLKEKLSKYIEISNNLESTSLAIMPKIEGTYTTTDYSIKILNQDKIPKKYTKKVVDIDKITDFVKRTQGLAPIPGIKIIKKNNLVIRQLKDEKKCIS
jgi:adenylate kinase family enzyme